MNKISPVKNHQKNTAVNAAIQGILKKAKIS
jgi:hypothetical protein